MNTCKNCKHQFELQHGTIQVCPLCGEQIVDAENTDELNLEILADEETIDLESIEEDDEFFELDESVEISDSAPTVDVEEPVAAGEDDSFEIIDSEFEIGSDSNQTELEPTFIGTQDPDYEDNLLLPRAPIGDDENTESIDSTPYAETEEGTINQDDESPEKTEVATEFFDPAEKQPTIELPDEEFSATSLDYAEREIIGLNAEENLNQDADYVISIEEDGSELGSGASGIVYKAIQKSLGRTVALKLLKKQVKADTQSQPRRTTPKQKDVEKFLYESQITAGLDHPNVITVHDLGVTSNDTLFYSMKLFEGGKDWSKDFDENSLVENLDIFNDVCDAMRRAHRDRITHRDLKPQNVLVGDFGEVQVTDWGLAIDIKIDSHSKISGGGTPCYMAPEMSSHYIAQQDLRLYTSKLKWTQDNAPENFDEIEILNEKIKECEAQEKAFCQLINEQSDVYVLGAILFQIAAGFPPHLFQISDIHRKQWGSQAGKNKVRNELLMSSKGKFANYIVKNLSNKEAREALRDIAEKAMRFQPRQRFESVAALQQAVRDFRDFMRCIEDTHRGDREVVNSKDDPKSYVNLNNAMYAYEGALENYPDYEPAHRGLAKARFLFAERALNNEDFELGLSTMTDEAIDQQPDTTLARQLQSELTSQRNRRDRRKRLLFIATMASLVSIAIGIAFGIYAAMAAQRANLAVRKAAEANVDLVDARKKVRTSKEKLTASLVDQKKAMADTIELSAQAATAELQKQLFDQKNSVSNSNAKIALLNSQLSQKQSEFESKNANLSKSIAESDVELAELAKFEAQITSEKIKEDTQFEQYKSFLRIIESNIDKPIARTQLKDLFKSSDVSLPIKNAWEAHHLYKRAYPEQQALRENLEGKFRLTRASKDGHVIIALKNANQLVRFDSENGDITELQILPENSEVISMDLSQDGRWLVIAIIDAERSQSPTNTDYLPLVYDLKSGMRIPFDPEVAENLRFLAVKQDDTDNVCNEKFFCQVQQVQILSSDEDNLSLFLADQRAQLGLNQIRCSHLDLNLENGKWNGSVKKAKAAGQLFLQSPGLLTEAGCLTKAIVLPDQTVASAVISSHPRFGINVFSLDEADRLLSDVQNLKDQDFVSGYFEQLDLNTLILDSISPNFVPTAMEGYYFDDESKTVKVVVGNGKGEIVEIRFRQPEFGFCYSVESARLLNKPNVNPFSEDGSKLVQQRSYSISRQKPFLSSTLIGRNTKNSEVDNSNVHRSAVRSIERVGNSLFTCSETEILSWEFAGDQTTRQKKLFGQNGKFATLNVIDKADYKELLTISNLRNARAEIRKWFPNSSLHDATIPLKQLTNKIGKARVIAAGTADMAPHSNAVTLAYQDGTLGYYRPEVGMLPIVKPADANVSNSQDKISKRDFGNARFKYFADREQLVMYTNSIGLNVWNLQDTNQTDPIRFQKPGGIYEGESTNSSIFLAADTIGDNLVTSHPTLRDRLVLWQRNPEGGFDPFEIGPLVKLGAEQLDQLELVVQPSLSPDGKTIACVLRFRNAYQIQLLEASPSKNPKKFFEYSSRARTSFRSIKFLSNSEVLITQDRVQDANQRETTTLKLSRNIDGFWEETVNKLPSVLTEQFGEISIADFTQWNDVDYFVAFGLPNTSTDEARDACKTISNNRHLILYGRDQVLFTQKMPFSRRIKPTFHKGQLLFLESGLRGKKPFLTSIQLDETVQRADIQMPEVSKGQIASAWNLAGDGRCVMIGNNELSLAQLNNNQLLKTSFFYSLANPATQVQLSHDKILLHHQDQSASLIKLANTDAAPKQESVLRVPGFFKQISMSPDGKSIAMVDRKENRLKLINSEKLINAKKLTEAIEVGDPTTVISWAPANLSRRLKNENRDVDGSILVSATQKQDGNIQMKFWDTKGKPINFPHNSNSILPHKKEKGQILKSITFSNVTGKLAAVQWDGDENISIWNCAPNRKPENEPEDEKVQMEWFPVNATKLGKVVSIDLSEIKDERISADKTAPRIAVCTEQEGSKSIRLMALELGLEFQAKPMLDIFVAEKLQHVDRMIDAQFSGDGKTLLTMTASRAQIRLSDGWDSPKADVEHANVIRAFQRKLKNKNRVDIIARRDQFQREKRNLDPSQFTSSLKKQIELEQANLGENERQVGKLQVEFESEFERIQETARERVKDEIIRIDEEISRLESEIKNDESGQ